MSGVQAITERIGAGRVVSAARRGINKRLNQLPGEIHTESKAKAKIKAEGSCAGMVSWSVNRGPAQRENIKAEGSCAGLVSWSMNQSAVDKLMLN